MKQLHVFLKCFIFVELGSCVARSLGDYLDYLRYPELYAMRSAPWYTGILIRVSLTAIVIALTAIAYFVVGRVLKKREKKAADAGSGSGCV